MKKYILSIYRAESKKLPEDFFEVAMYSDPEIIEAYTDKDKALDELSKHTSTAYKPGDLWLIECYVVQECEETDGDIVEYYDIYTADQKVL